VCISGSAASIHFPSNWWFSPACSAPVICRWPERVARVRASKQSRNRRVQCGKDQNTNIVPIMNPRSQVRSQARLQGRGAVPLSSRAPPARTTKMLAVKASRWFSRGAGRAGVLHGLPRRFNLALSVSGREKSCSTHRPRSTPTERQWHVATRKKFEVSPGDFFPAHFRLRSRSLA
jgi:hypothetical protein